MSGRTAWITATAPKTLTANWARTLEARLLDRALEAVAGIVDQHVDPAGLAQRVLDALAHARFVGDVEQDAKGSAGCELLELGPARLVPERAGDLVAALQSGFGQGPPKPLLTPVISQLVILCSVVEFRRRDGRRSAPQSPMNCCKLW